MIHGCEDMYTGFHLPQFSAVYDVLRRKMDLVSMLRVMSQTTGDDKIYSSLRVSTTVSPAAPLADAPNSTERRACVERLDAIGRVCVPLPATSRNLT